MYANLDNERYSLLVAASCLALGGIRGREPEKGKLRGEDYLFPLSNPLIFYFSFHPLHM